MALSGLEGLLDDSRRNAVASWLLIALLATASVGVVVVAGPLWSLFAFVLLVLAIIPPVAYRSPSVMLPWEVLLMAALPVVGLTLGSERLSSQFAAYFAVAAIALVIAVELESFTTIRLSPGFAIVLVVAGTLATAALWGVVQWGFDVYLGTGYIGTNEELMYEWVYSAVAGLFAGGVFILYFRRHPGLDPTLIPGAETTTAGSSSDSASGRASPVSAGEADVAADQPTKKNPLRSRLGISERRQRQLTRVMEISLIGLLFVGLERGSVGVIVNTGVALLVTRIPGVLERDYNLSIDPLIALWITSAAFLHALGTVGIPGMGWNFYSGLPWWDHMTHALSASVVAAAGYATVRAIDEHSAQVYLPSKFIAVIILLFVLAFGVLWELLEFAIGIVADSVGMRSVLTQYGVYDTLWDIVYNTMGGLFVALWGGVYLSSLSTSLAERLENR